jgi:hypothetical protein
MLREKVIITKLPISQPGQIQHFQVKIPRDAKRIIGIEVSAQYMNMQTAGGPQPIIGIGFNAPSHYSYMSLERKAMGRNIFTITPDLFLGDVRLQSCEDTNVFFAEDVYYTDENLGFGDFSIRTPRFRPSTETHGYKRHECVVNTNGETTILKGIYRDRQKGAQANVNSLTGQIFFQYTANIYVWYELKTKEA